MTTLRILPFSFQKRERQNAQSRKSPVSWYRGFPTTACGGRDVHIGKWRELFTRLKPGGVIYVEDLFQRGPSFSQEEHRILKNDVNCEDLITQTKMTTLLRELGFECVDFSDVTAKWTPYVVTRTETFDAQLDKHIEVDGEDAAKALSHFYSAVARVFTMGNLGGYTLVARRPLRPEDSSEATTEP